MSNHKHSINSINRKCQQRNKRHKEEQSGKLKTRKLKVIG